MPNQEHEREREIKHIATGTYPQPRGWNTPSSSWRVSGCWRWPLVMVSPSGKVPKQGPDWVLVATKACGSGTPDLGYFLEVWGFIGEVGIENKSGGPTESPWGRGALGGRALHPMGPTGLPSGNSSFQYFLYFPEKISFDFQRIPRTFISTQKHHHDYSAENSIVRVSSNQIIPKACKNIVNMAWIFHKL